VPVHICDQTRIPVRHGSIICLFCAPTGADTIYRSFFKANFYGIMERAVMQETTTFSTKARTSRTIVHVRAPKLIGIGSSSVKHVVLATRSGRTSPKRNILCESGSLIKHVSHVTNFGGVPKNNGLVERARSIKHVIHGGHLGSIPLSNRSVEARRMHEHLFH